MCALQASANPSQKPRSGNGPEVPETHDGENLAEHLTVKAGQYLYIPAGMPHLPYNPSDTEPAVAVVARTDPNEQESVVLLPELDALRP